MIKKVLTIAGSDCSGGAGIQADIKTITAHKMYAMSAITALTAQNTTGVFGIVDIDPAFVENQLDCIFSDIFPDAVKIGMVSNAELIKSIAKKLKQYNAKNIVVDPVMVSTSGSKLLSDDAQSTLINELFPLATVITPNIPEAETISGEIIKTQEDMFSVCSGISEKYGVSVLLKGGHLSEKAADVLYKNGKETWFFAERIENPNTHGTGCTLSSAIACNLAKGLTLEESISEAKKYLTVALSAMLDIGKGRGPLNHMFN